MSTDNLINNIEQNDNMERNISILSNQSTISPEELSYVIDINDAELYIPNANVYIPDIKNSNENNNTTLRFMKIQPLTIVKLLSVVLVVLLAVWVCFYM